MADSNCMRINPVWHLSCQPMDGLGAMLEDKRRLVFTPNSPVLIVCEWCHSYASVADTFSKEDKAKYMGKKAVCHD